MTQYEHWAAGDAYEQFMGRWSSAVAMRFLAWLNLAHGQRWLDVGCGTGALTRAIAGFAQPLETTGLDSSLGFVKFARQQVPQAVFWVADGGALAVGNARFDAIVSGLALNFMPRPDRVLTDMRRGVKQGGVVAAYVWDYAGQMEFLRYFWDAAVALDAKAVPFHEGHRFPLCQPEPLRDLWQEAGFEDVIVAPLDIHTRFDSFERYWQSFTLGDFPAPRYALSLGAAQFTALRERLRAVLPTNNDGAIHLTARVWAVRGHR